MQFTLHKQDGLARRGTLTLTHGNVETPAFMPVGTYGTVKAMSPLELEEINAHIVLGNTFHLWLSPGTRRDPLRMGVCTNSWLEQTHIDRFRWISGMEFITDCP